MDIRRWLEGLNLGQYADLFDQNEIDAEMLRELSEADLEKLGITSLGHRKKILRGASADLAITAPAETSGTYEEEIELRHYFDLLWRYRKIFAITLALFTLGFWSLKGLQFFWQTPPSSYYSSLITLSFPGYEQDKYPNDSDFEIGDIIASNVLRQVYQEQGLNPEKIPLNEFIKAFKVSYVSQEKDFIIDTYTKRLDALDEKMLSQAEELKIELQKELNRSARSQVELQFEKNNDWPLHQAQVYTILESVPNTWQEVSVREKGIFAPNVARYGAVNLFNYDDIFGKNEPLIGLEMLKQNIDYFNSYIGDLGRIPNIHNYSLTKNEIRVLSDSLKQLSVVVERLSGATLSLNDIKKSLFEIENFTLSRLVFSYTDLSIITNAPQVLMFYDSQIFNLQRTKDLLQSQVTVINDVVESYASLIGQDSPITDNNATGSTSATPQIDASFLQSLIELAGKSDDIAYKKSLIDELKKYKLELSQIENDILHLEKLKSRINQNKTSDNEVEKKQELEASILSTVQLLAGLMEAALVIEDKTGHQNVLDRSMFTSLGYGQRGKILSEVLSGGNIKIFVVAIVVLLMLETLGVFLHAYIKDSSTESRNA
jgi:hypothetical protein